MIQGEIIMLCNQLMVLLSLYRNTFEMDKHQGTLEQDLTFLRENELIKDDNSLSTKGKVVVETILRCDTFNWK